jgi:nucleotide-binding universal stress UspA family protein
LPSWRRPSDPLKVARRQLLADIGALAETATVLIDEGEVAEAVLRTTEAHDCDLTLTGVARDELLERLVLGTSVDRLLRRSRIPVLVVKNRVRQPYHRIVVATDFSDSSRHALEAAARYFPNQTLTIFHAYNPPLSGWTGDPAAYRREYRKVAEQDYDAFLQSAAVSDVIKQHARPLIEYGAPSQLLREYVRDMNVDLVVLGSHGRSAVFDVLIGSVARQLVSELRCDALVIREPRAATERPA